MDDDCVVVPCQPVAATTRVWEAVETAIAHFAVQKGHRLYKVPPTSKVMLCMHVVRFKEDTDAMGAGNRASWKELKRKPQKFACMSTVRTACLCTVRPLWTVWGLQLLFRYLCGHRDGAAHPLHNTLNILAAKYDGRKRGSLCAFWYPTGHRCCVAYTLDNTIFPNTVARLYIENSASIFLTIFIMLRSRRRC